ncbi:MAG TPA: hypothetical protein VLT10_00460 [Verrucomicrobiae bacterium]|nr:hypothetical protein [Verrucomicrobiae bacterium]
MSSENLPNWDKMWFEYNKILKAWMGAFESLQRATNDVQAMYHDVMGIALKDPNNKTMAEFTQNWQNTMTEFAKNWQQTMDQFTDYWQKAATEVGTNAFKQSGDNWIKMFNQAGMEQVKSYGEMMNKFAETWQKMWTK